MHISSPLWRSLLCRSALFAVSLMAFAPSVAFAADDLGVSSELKGIYRPDKLTVTTYKGGHILMMGGDPVQELEGRGAIYTSLQMPQGWTQPRVAFAKPGCSATAPAKIASTGLPPRYHNGVEVPSHIQESEDALLTKPACPAGVDPSSPEAQGYTLSNPSIVKHPTFDQYYMFYTMRSNVPEKKTITDPTTHKSVTITQPAEEQIGVAYAKPCSDSYDGSGLCWRDLSTNGALMSSKNANVMGGVSAVLQGVEVALYHRTSAPNSQIVRTIVDTRDWKVKGSTPLTFEQLHPILKKWYPMGTHQQVAIQNIDVKPYGKGFLMVGNDGSANSLSRWKSSDGINFYSDPYDGNSPVVFGHQNTLSGATLESNSDKDFTVYYTSSNTSACQLAQPCHNNSIIAHHLSEEKNPKIVENDFWDKDYVPPDYEQLSKPTR